MANGRPEPILPPTPLATACLDGPALLAEPPEAALAMLLAGWAARVAGRSLAHLARSETRMLRLAEAARAFAPDLEVVVVPPWDCLPYDRSSPACAVMARRLEALRRLAEPP